MGYSDTVAWQSSLVLRRLSNGNDQACFKNLNFVNSGTKKGEISQLFIETTTTATTSGRMERRTTSVSSNLASTPAVAMRVQVDGLLGGSLAT